MNWIRKHSLFHFPKQNRGGENVFPVRTVFTLLHPSQSERHPNIPGAGASLVGGRFCWRTLLGVLDSLLQHSGETDEWVACPDPEIWKAWWAALEHVMGISADQTAWEWLFATKISSTMEIHRRLSGPRGVAPVTWLTSDATPAKAGSINWRKREFATVSVDQLLDPSRVYRPKEVYMQARELAIAVYVVVCWMEANTDGEIALMGMGNSDAISWTRKGKAIAGIYREIVSSF